ncbi:hypothetical protein FB566_2251 [Stackebrandtia endophytica]|uniref:Uncharacterized protein n=1 Tax=Stackebrandtia endophytica TaxID=1496996 RepID=A0A543AVV4_9ACTN|nr:hypothetical protein [Stackebrandtia endophytica]TQL76716.1 hypothetical protein FB566_2251 [Stackebrandtia endophytica]
MSWTSITTSHDAITLTRAQHIRQTHTRTRRGLRKVCIECGNRWGRYGCALATWATDQLSRMSRIVIPNPPKRPKHRHRPRYIRLLTQGAHQARTLYRTRPQPARVDS